MANDDLDPIDAGLMDNETTRQLKQMADTLARYVEASEDFRALRSDDGYSGLFDYIPKLLRCFRWEWSLDLVDVVTENLDRRQALLGGPLFTSSYFPWPKDENGFLQPIAQIDLDLANELSGMTLGHGMLQVWTNAQGTRSLFRTIPTRHLKEADLSSIPEGLGMAQNLELAFSLGMSDWGNNPHACSQQIVGVGTKKLTWPRSLVGWLSDLEAASDGYSARQIRGFLEQLPEVSESRKAHLFGNFREIQYTAAERPPCLLALDSEEPFCWGDNGSAQIFFNPVRKVIDINGNTRTPMSFEWSCV